ncbi:MAG: hypothetical protein LBG96_15850 [Tannerella sp.]|jgi:hypothetical protein|nr:hypothetical protein [Tannerella sp.]
MKLYTEEKKIRLREIPVTVELGDLCENVSMAHKAMTLICEGKTNDAFHVVKEILNKNYDLVSATVDVEKVKKLLDAEVMKPDTTIN